ncbi:MAG: sulfatase [Armatimonadota bacterium]|nr:MAG: sulfatase [Armatimonadota bacterium]
MSGWRKAIILVALAALAVIAVIAILPRLTPKPAAKDLAQPTNAVIPVARAPANLAVGAGLSPPSRRRPVVVQAFEFERPGDAEGWQPGLETCTTAVADGQLRVKRQASPASCISLSLDLAADEFNVIQARVRQHSASVYHARWLDDRGRPSPPFYRIMAPSSEWRVVSVSVGDSAHWKGRITRLDFTLASGGDTAWIDWIRLLRDDNPSFLIGPDRLGYAIEQRRKWVMPCRIPGEVTRRVTVGEGDVLSFACGLTKQAWQSHRGRVRAEVSLAVDGNEAETIASVDLLPKALGGSWGWVEGEASISKWSGQTATLAFHARSTDPETEAMVVWGNPTVTSTAPAARDRPNVVILLSDAMRPDHLSLYGYARRTSPNLERLGKDGVVFERAFAHSPSTHLSVPSLLTSLYPLEAVEQEAGFTRIGQEHVTLAELLEEAGYATAAFSANAFVNWDYAADQGFADFAIGQASAGELTDEALQWLAAHKRQPFFAYVHYMDTHAPYAPPESYRSAFVGRDYEPADPLVRQGDATGMRRRMARGHVYSDADRRYLVGLYDAAIASTDHSIGRVVDWLRAAGLYDDTVIVVCADHGEEFWERGGLEHARTLYQESVRVPLILKLPPEMIGDRAKRVMTPVGLVDIYPTLSQLAGLEPPDGLRGRSLLGVPPTGERAVYAVQGVTYAIRKTGWTLIVGPHAENGVALYDVTADPGETTNVASQHPEITAEMRAQLSRIHRSGAPRPATRKDAGEGRRQPDGVTLERLRALGYAE